MLIDDLLGLPSCLEASAFHTLALQRPEEGFGDRIIVTVPHAAHACGDAGFGKHGSICITGILFTNNKVADSEPSFYGHKKTFHAK